MTLHCQPDWSFPFHQPDPECDDMLLSMKKKQQDSIADIAFGFDGDGDRCGFIDDRGRIIPADKIGLLIAREISQQYPGSHFVIDSKSTMLFEVDQVLHNNDAVVHSCKTGHSHIKHLMNQTGAIAGFEKSGHFYFSGPLGRGYDDAIMAAIQVCELLDCNGNKSLSQLVDELPLTFCRQPVHFQCDETIKAEIIDDLAVHCQHLMQAGDLFIGQKIIGCDRLDGIRLKLADGSWVMARASANGPYLVVVGESLKSEYHYEEMIRYFTLYLVENLRIEFQ